MRYKEYLVKLNGSEKKLGVFGEQHIYTPSESRFAKKIIPDFDTVAVEGSNKKSFIYWIGILYLPMILALILGTNRSFKNDTSNSLAKKYKKKVVMLEKGAEHFKLTQKIALVAAGLFSIPYSPFLYASYKFYGDPFEKWTKAHEKRMANKKKGKKGLFSGFFEYAYKSNLKERDRIMAKKSIDLLRKNSGSLLIVCGESHLDGIIKNLDKKLKLKEIRSYHF